MVSTKESSSRNELFFLNYDIDDIKGPNLPTNGDVLRYYFYLRTIQPKDAPRATARVVVTKCRKIWSDNGIPTTHEANGVKYLLKMLRKFDKMRSEYDRCSVIRRKQSMAIWQEKFEVVFCIATKDALNKCSEKSRKMLLAAKEQVKEFRKATNNDKWLNDFEKQEKIFKAGSSTRSKSSEQSEVKDVSVDKKTLVDRPKRKLGVNRPGPKSSKKRRVNDASDKDLKVAASVTSVLSNSDTLNNNQAAELTTTSEVRSNSNQQELVSEKLCSDAVITRGLDVGPEEEDIIPPMVQKTIIKEEIDMDWDQSDNWSTSLLFNENFPNKGDKENNPFEQMVNFSHMAYQL